MKKYLFRNEGLWAIQHLGLGEVGEKAWNEFTEGLNESFRWAFDEEVEIVVHNLEDLELEIRERTREFKTISVDPCIEGNINLGVSRIFLPGGNIEVGIQERPGFPLLQEQIKLIPVGEYALIEDDIFSGGTIQKVIELLDDGAVNVKKLIVGMKVGNPELSVPVEALHAYDSNEVVDLNDPRDFLAGAYGGGLVVHYSYLPWSHRSQPDRGSKVRVPYVFPFVDSAARSSIPRERVLEFSQRVWQLNLQFWKKFSQVQVQHVDPYFQIMMTKWDIDPGELMSTLCIRMLEVLEFPEIEFGCDAEEGVIWFDLNDTLITDDGSMTNTIQVENVERAIRNADEYGWQIGLCSDSPHSVLKEWGKRYGIDGPTIAENGQLLNGNAISSEVINIQEIKELVTSWATGLRISILPDALAPEFGGVKSDGSGIAFGADRISSVSVFCLKNGKPDGSLVNNLGMFLQQSLGGWRNLKTSRVNYSEEHGFIAIHAGHYAVLKGKTLRAVGYSLYKQGKKCWMIGDSLNDFTHSPALCPVGIVGSGEEKARKGAEKVSVDPLTAGALELLRHIGAN